MNIAELRALVANVPQVALSEPPEVLQAVDGEVAEARHVNPRQSTG